MHGPTVPPELSVEHRDGHVSLPDDACHELGTQDHDVDARACAVAADSGTLLDEPNEASHIVLQELHGALGGDPS